MAQTIASCAWMHRSATMALSVAPLGAALLATSPASAQESDPIRITVEQSAIPALVADDRGFFGDLAVEVSMVGYGQVAALLVAGETEVTWISPIETAEFVSEGSDFKYFSTAGALNMYNGVVVSADDADQYSSLEDLEGERLGIPGYGTGTWATFEAFVRAYYDMENPQETFDIVTASSGALLALVERGEVKAALVFAGPSAAARSLPQFETIFSFTEAMRENTGQPLVVNGPVATTEWLESNPEAAARIVAGLDEATRWMNDNPDAFSEGGTYADLAEQAGWLSEAATTSGIQNLLSEGQWYLTSDAYTEKWQSAVYSLIQRGETLENVPEQDAIFIMPGSLGGAN